MYSYGYNPVVTPVVHPIVTPTYAAYPTTAYNSAYQSTYASTTPMYTATAMSPTYVPSATTAGISVVHAPNGGIYPSSGMNSVGVSQPYATTQQYNTSQSYTNSLTSPANVPTTTTSFTMNGTPVAQVTMKTTTNGSSLTHQFSDKEILEIQKRNMEMNVPTVSGIPTEF